MQAGTQSDSSKSTTQEMYDKSRREKDQQVHGGTGPSVIDKVKSAVGLGDDKPTVWWVLWTFLCLLLCYYIFVDRENRFSFIIVFYCKSRWGQSDTIGP